MNNVNSARVKIHLALTKLTAVVLSLGIVGGLVACQHTSRTLATQDPSRWPKISSPQVAKIAESQQVAQILVHMSTEEKVGQILQAEIQAVTADDIKKYHLGSVLNGGGSLPHRKTDASVQDWIDLADGFYEASMDESDGRVGIPIIWGTDAVHGHNNVSGATLFPHNMALGAARNPELIRRIGEATAKVVRATAIDWVFAPTLAVAQNDLWGRTYESYSEDPLIVAEYAAAMVEGLQGQVGSDSFLSDQHVLACAKHFLGDGGTVAGDDQGDARIDETALAKVHNAGYPPAIKSGVQSIMASFSSWNGEKLHGHKYLLTDVLRGQMGFDGVVVGDWNGHGQVPGCTNESCAAAINAGIDLVMVPYDWRAMYVNTLKQVKAGEISMARLDEAVSRILTMKIRAGLFAGKPSARMNSASAADIVGSQAHRDLARQAVRESLVLLKNNQQTLPLHPQQHILVVGDSADSVPLQSGGWSITWQGTGLSNKDFPGATTIYQGIKDLVTQAGGTATLALDGKFSQKPDAAIVVFGEQPYAEGQGDRETLEFEPGVKKALAQLRALKAQNIPVVSVFVSGRPMWVNPELNASDAFVAAWLPGSEGAGIAEVLFSQPNGSVAHDFKGRLSFSWPKLPLQSEVNGPDYASEPLFELGYGLRYASTPEALAQLPEEVKGVETNEPKNINFYVGRTLQPWHVFVRSADKEQVLSGAFTALNDGDIKLQTIDKDLQEDALRFSWKNTWRAGLHINGGKPIDLAPFVDGGILSFDLNIKAFPKSSLELELICGANCNRKLSLRDYAQQHIGSGWQNLRVDVNCFKHDGDNLTAVPQPFNLNAGGEGEIEVANVKFLLAGKANFTCPDYKSLSTKAEPLNEYWAEDWWMPRHEAVLKHVAKGDAELLMIGDSITQGWEEAGSAVWQQYYADRKAINLGFGGDRTENVLWRLQNGEVEGISPKLAVLMIGTNNTGHRLEDPALTANGIKNILAELRQRLPKTKILLLGVFPREAEPSAPMRQINAQINKKIATYADGKDIYYLDIGAVFLSAEGILEPRIMPDMLHLSEYGYKLWAQAMEAEIVELLVN